jgi:LmbE family N-acetylglucosaminyl deacetylase
MLRAVRRQVWAAAVCGLLSCALVQKPTAQPRYEVEVLVIAPHPDDEALLAAGVMQRAIAKGQRVAVIVMTNGDSTCERNGYVRERETVNALRRVGVPERDVHFLGYPDGALSLLGPTPLPVAERRDEAGQCVKATGTYGVGGANGQDEHTARTGKPGEYTADALIGDLASLLTRLRPRHVYVTHGIDAHPDHAATYAFFRRALDRSDIAAPLVHRGIVHAGPCWPGDCEVPFQPSEGVPALPAPLERFVPRERLPVDPSFKLEVISDYPSQTGSVPRTDWLASFARREEVFYPETLVRAKSGRWVRGPAPGQGESQPAQELELEFKHGLLQRVTASRDTGFDEFELFLSPNGITLNRVEGPNRRRIATWPRPYTESTTLQLRVDPRPDDGEVSEWSVWGEEGFIGQAVVLMPAKLKVEAKLPPT